MLDSQALQLADNLSLNRSFPATLPIILKKSNTENKSSESPAILFSPELGFEEIDKRNKNALSKINADLYVQRGSSERLSTPSINLEKCKCNIMTDP